MDDQARDIGGRVRYWRQRRQLDRKQFADMVGRSTSWLDKVEKGERNLLRLPMLERVAEALGVAPAALTDEPSARQVAQCVDPAEVRAIRGALGKYPGLAATPADKPVSVRRAMQQAAYLDHAWLSSHFTVVAQHLPPLMRDAQAAIATAPADAQVDAFRVLVTTYRLASSMLLKFDAHDLAWLAADRAMHTALGVDDTWSLARATRSVARAMTSSGQRQEAVTTLLAMGDRMRPELATRAESLLSLYGMLYLAAAITAAEEENHELAGQMHDEATAAARRFAPHFQTHHTYFGSTNVAIHRVAALVRLHEAGRALEFAATIAPAAVTALSPERRANYLLDLTEAHTQTGRYGEAVWLLDQAERIAPEEVRCRPLAHGLLRSLLDTTRGDAARSVRQMAERAGVSA